jgi:hypothetical protein
MSYWDDINEGFGAIRYNYYNDRYAYGKNSLNSSNRVSSKETAMNFRAKRLKEIYEMNRKTFGGIKETKTFKVNENVEATSTITLASGYIRSGVKGVVAEVYDNSYVIDFGGRAGKVAIAKQVAEESFVARPVTGTRDILRKTIEGSLTVGDSINIGDRVVDAEGRQYAIEQADVFGRRFKALSENGVTRVLDKSEVKKIAEDAPLAGEEMPSAAGKMVRIVGIDPQSNSLRARGIPSGSQENVVGQVGVVEFAYYPTGVTAPMFRVLLQGYGRRDFTGAELAPADGPQMAQEDYNRRSSLSEIKRSKKSSLPFPTKGFLDLTSGELEWVPDDEVSGKDNFHDEPNNSPLKLPKGFKNPSSGGRRSSLGESAAHHSDKNVRHAAATDHRTHPDVLHLLSQDNDMDVRRAVAMNPNTRPDTLSRLRRDADRGVRRSAVADGPQMAQEGENSLPFPSKVNEAIAKTPFAQKRKVTQGKHWWCQGGDCENRMHSGGDFYFVALSPSATANVCSTDCAKKLMGTGGRVLGESRLRLVKTHTGEKGHTAKVYSIRT